MAADEHMAMRECGELNTTFAVLLDDTMAEKLRQHCEHHNVSISSYIRSLIEKDLGLKYEVDQAYFKQMNYYNRIKSQEDDGK